MEIGEKMKTKNKIWAPSSLFLFVSILLGYTVAIAATDLADRPLFASSSVTGNVALALSVEFPTALGSAYTTGYSTATNYLGYFDPNKCYDYHTELDVTKHYFEPVAAAAGHVCTGKWSGNFLNWALTQTIDPFRYALTGGYRRIDEVGLTVLEKAYASQNSSGIVNPTISNNADLIAGATPYNFSNFKIRINSLGTKFYFTSTGDNYNPGAVIPDTLIPAEPLAGRVYEMYARVRVCLPGSLEANCTEYNGNYKPTGLIQKNALKLNFAAFGYLNDNNINRDGGVLRAKMRQLGPLKSVPNSANVTNPNPEWDSNGVFFQNPDPDAAAITGVANSGVINYLNKFGLTAPGYKTYDPVSELYYTVIRYFKNQGNVPEYTNGATTFMKDGFPVITDWDDPIKYSCQQNFIIGIGDTNSHEDANLPGSTLRGAELAMPATVAADTTVDVRVATNRVGALQGLGNRGEVLFGDQSSYFMAGLAFDSHTKDFRADFDGKQTVATYWLDVLESGFVNNNQYFLAAKFGGFDVPAGFDPYAGAATPLATVLWNKNADTDPDNYFRANNPGLMITNLNKAFDDILKKISGSSGGFAIPTPTVSNGSMSFATSYTVDGWTGNVIGNTLSVSGNGVSETLAWNAVDKLEVQAAGTGWRDNRYIATANCTSANPTLGTQDCTGRTFRLGSLSSEQITDLSASGADPQNMLDFLRGDKSNAGASGLGIFRDRKKLLGDIVNSKVTAIGPPNGPFTDAFNPGYSSFKSSKSSRETVAYVGANDGMLHAFRGIPTGGNELFAFVPNAFFAGPNNTPDTDGLVALAKSSYVHHNYVDATPVIQDVFYSGNWHSLLVSGLGKGGKSYFAIDVTNPSTLSSEGNLSSAVKWEFTHKHMGYTYGNPVMVKTAQHGWVVILTSGYNNDDGKGYFFIVRPETGELLQTISTGEGTISNPAGLAHANAYVSDFRDFTSDAVYAGDLLGNVWRLDLNGMGAYAAPTKIATLDIGGQPQPVTTAPLIEVDQSTSKRFVFVATGKLLADSDVNNTQQQTFYAINDGTTSTLYNASTLPANSGGFPITRNKLVDNTTSVSGVDINADPTKPMGYFINLGYGANGIAYRVNIPMVSGAGVVAFAANLTGGDECTPSGSNKFYALAYGTGQSILSLNGVPVKSIAGQGLAASLTGYVSDGSNGGGGGGGGGGPCFTVCSAEGVCTTQCGTSPASGGFNAINWRELPSAD